MRNLDGPKGHEIEVRIIKLNKKRGRTSSPPASNCSKKSSPRSGIRPGTVARRRNSCSATVENLTDYGAFVDLGGIDGLLAHHRHVMGPPDASAPNFAQVGDSIQVKVSQIDREKQRVSLGFKQLTPNPWLDAAERYPIGAHVHGRVISVTDYGAFVELEQGIEGLVHVSEMTWSKRMKHPSKLVNIADQVEAVVLNVNPQERRISNWV